MRRIGAGGPDADRSEGLEFQARGPTRDGDRLKGGSFAGRDERVFLDFEDSEGDLSTREEQSEEEERPEDAADEIERPPEHVWPGP
jgi:hypothetical protein